jgi:hypothetical protein
MNKGLVCLIMNLVYPGCGSLIAGDKSNGFWQLGLWWGGILTLVFGVGAFAMLGGWIWALLDGLKYNESLSGNLTKGNIALILNLNIPGIGTIAFGDKNNGVWQFLLFVFGGVLGGFGTLAGLIWSLIDGLSLNDTVTEEI